LIGFQLKSPNWQVKERRKDKKLPIRARNLIAFGMTWFGWAVLALIILKWGAQLTLEKLNERHVRSHSQRVPEAFKEVMDEPTYQKAVRYTLAHAKFNQVEFTWAAAVLLVVLFTGVLPWGFQFFREHWGTSIWSRAAFLFAAGLALTLPGLPLDWYSQFRLEQKFGFNTTTQTIWWIDRLKGFLLAAVLGYPLLVLILKVARWAGASWWLWAWATLMAFQLLLMVLAPVLILPLFNKFQPLAEGSLRSRLLELARRAQFRAQSIQVMDGSKRSNHSNAFFTGFGRFRKIVLFDTLLTQLSEPELEAVLAHEIGHYRRHHIPKLLGASFLMSLAGFFVLSWLARQGWFLNAFGFSGTDIAPVLLLFGLLSGLVTFWFSPLSHLWSRKFEYEADAFAAQMMHGGRSLVAALRKLNEKNLSNLTPHPAYSGFYYSHPTLIEREQALEAA
jgi:STE24 endopeptidase